MKKHIIITVIAVILPLFCSFAQDAVLENIMTRTSVRSFTGEPVSREQLETIIKAGMAAPTAISGSSCDFPSGISYTIVMDGGPLQIFSNHGALLMTGPARTVYSGSIAL